MILRCTIKYDAKHLQVNKDTKLSKKLFKGFMFGSKTIYNKPCATQLETNVFIKMKKKRGKTKKNKKNKKNKRNERKKKK